MPKYPEYFPDPHFEELVTKRELAEWLNELLESGNWTCKEPRGPDGDTGPNYNVVGEIRRGWSSDFEKLVKKSDLAEWRDELLETGKLEGKKKSKWGGWKIDRQEKG